MDTPPKSKAPILKIPAPDAGLKTEPEERFEDEEPWAGLICPEISTVHLDPKTGKPRSALVPCLGPQCGKWDDIGERCSYVTSAQALGMAYLSDEEDPDDGDEEPEEDPEGSGGEAEEPEVENPSEKEPAHAP